MNVSKLSFFALVLSLFMFSCTDGVVNTTEDLVISEDGFERGDLTDMCGGSCFDIVFPVSMNMPDGSTVSFEDVETLRTSLQEWRKANAGEYETRPEFVFPITVILEDETESEIASAEDFRALMLACKPFLGKGKRGDKMRGGKGGLKGRLDSCFTLVYPVSFAFPDGSEVEYNSASEVKAGLKSWKESVSDDVEGRPELVFPVWLTLADGSEQEVASAEEIKAIRESCRSDR